MTPGGPGSGVARTPLRFLCKFPAGTHFLRFIFCAFVSPCLSLSSLCVCLHGLCARACQCVCACAHIHVYEGVPTEARRVPWSSYSWIWRGLWAACDGHWEPNPSPLQEEQVFLSSEPFNSLKMQWKKISLTNCTKNCVSTEEMIIALGKGY